MEILSILQNPATPCVILGLIFGFAGHYFETKPQIIFLGLLALGVVHFISYKPEDKSLQSDIYHLQNENESLKNNLMQVYSMVKQQPDISSGPSGPPPPIPPSMTGVRENKEIDEDEGAKPYL